jgi:glutamate 5-kinase
MVTKLQAADLARRSGAKVVIARGSDPDVISRIAADEPLGTRFSPLSSPVDGRKRYILAGGQTTGMIKVDPGAEHALYNGGSLLPVGVIDIDGSFERGDAVRIVTPSGQEIGRGLTNYSSLDLARISGKRSDEIEKILGFAYGDEVIHRSNMVVL